MATIYPGNIPSLEQLKVGDKIRFSGKLTEQDPNIQKLFGQNAATWDVDPTTNKNIGITVQKPYVLPGTSYLPGVSPSDSNYWGVNPDRLTPGTTTTPDYMSQFSALLGGTTAEPQNTMKVTDAFGNPTNPTAYSTYQDLIKAQQDALQSQYLANTAAISQQANAARQNQMDVGGRASGALKRLLGRAGGFTTTAGAQAMVGQQNTLDAQINALNIAQQNALDAAKSAYQTGNANIVKDAMSQLKAVEQAQAEAQQAKSEQLVKMLQLQEESRSNIAAETQKADAQKFEQEQAKFEMENPAIKTDVIDMLDADGKNYKVLINTATGDTIKKLGLSSTQPKKATGTKTTTTGTGGLPKTEVTKINTLIDTELKKLSKGGDWGTSWNYIRNLFPQSEYPSLTNEDIDSYLRKDQFYPKETPVVVQKSNPLVDWFKNNWDLRK